jgi:hypothetical protein
VPHLGLLLRSQSTKANGLAGLSPS